MKFLAKNLLRCLCVAALLIGHASAQERHLRTYSMRHALAEQVVPVLSTQLSPGSSVTPYRQQLILNVTDSEYEALQALLAQLDTAPHSLLISVRKQSQQHNNDERYAAQGHIGNGAVQVQSGNGEQTRVTINRSSTQSASDGSQQVRAVEGMQAFISTGNTVAMRNGDYGQRELVPVTGGFYATARIVDNEVIVDIDQHDDRVQGRGIATQGLQTQVRGRIGEWIPLGGLSTAQTSGERAISSYSNSAANSISNLAIKVDVVDR